MYPCRTWSLEPIMTLMMLIIRMILCVAHNGYNLHDNRECFKRSPESLSSLTFCCNLESWDLINLSWTLKGFCKSIIFQGKKNTFPTHRMSLAFWYPCTKLQGFVTRCSCGSNASLFAYIMARIVSVHMVCRNMPLRHLWSYEFVGKWLLRSFCLLQEVPYLLMARVLVVMLIIRMILCVTHNACNLHRECISAWEEVQNL
jgi:hypothetical protein